MSEQSADQTEHEADTAMARRLLHPRLASQLAQLGLAHDVAPDPASWNQLLATVHDHYAESERLSDDLMEAMRGWSSFENLFRISPIPIMEQDYSALERWMEDLRRTGVTSLREHLGDDLEAIRAIVPMIRIVAANPAAVRAVGLPLDRLIGPISPHIVNDGSQTGWLTQLQAVWDREPVAYAAFTAATASGVAYDAESILAAPVIAGSPDFSRAVFTVIDVTSHRNEERRMEDLVLAKNRFLAAVSHEIRTPLTAILGFSRLLHEDGAIAHHDRARMISSIVEHSQAVADLVEDLLVAARAEMGQIELVNTTFDLVDLINQTLRAGGSFTSGVSLRHEGELTRAVGDPARVRQIVRNLLTNAERYGGTQVSITVRDAAGWLQVDVVDDGAGLPVDQWERVFEPYHRAHESTDQPESVGIGLAISRQLTDLMGGMLDYRYESGHSIFRLSLQAASG
jgi:signal transduction histidine kinase